MTPAKSIGSEQTARSSALSTPSMRGLGLPSAIGSMYMLFQSSPGPGPKVIARAASTSAGAALSGTYAETADTVPIFGGSLAASRIIRTVLPCARR